MTKIELDLDEITKYIDDLKDTQARLKFELNEVEKKIKKEELKLMALIDKKGVDSIDWGIYSFGWKKTTRTAFDQKLFNQEHPDMFEKYKTTKENKLFEFKINR